MVGGCGNASKIVIAIVLALLVCGIGSVHAATRTDEFNVTMDKAVASTSWAQAARKAVDLKSYLDTNGSTRPLVVDLRPRAEYNASHIPSRPNGTTATINIYYRHLGKREALDYLDSELDAHEAMYSNRDVVVYGNTRHLSRMVSVYLNGMGYTTRALRMGLSEWVNDTVMQDRFKECVSFDPTTGKGNTTVTPNCTTNDFQTELSPAVNVDTLSGEGYPVLDNIAGPVTSANLSEVMMAAYDARFGNMSKPRYRMTAVELYDILDDNQDGVINGSDDTSNDPFVLSNRGRRWTGTCPTGPYYNWGHIPGAKAVDYCHVGDGRQELKTLNATDFMPMDKTIVYHCWVGVSQQYGGPYYNMLGYIARSLDWGIQGWTTDTTVRDTNNINVNPLNYPYDSGNNGTNHKPYVVLTSPSDGASFATNTTTFTASVWDMEGGNLNVSLWGDWGDGWSLKAYNDSTGFITEYNFTVTVQSDGVWIWNIRAEDAEGNINWSASNRTISINPTPPNVTIVSPSNNTYTTSGIGVNVTAWDDIEGSASTLNVTAELNGMNKSLTNVSGDWNTYWTGISDGPHVMRIYANDSKGNMNDTEVVYFTVDALPPYVNGSYVQPALYNGDGYTYTKNVFQNETQVINVSWADTGSDVNYSWLHRNDTNENYTSNTTSLNGNSFGWMFNETTVSTITITVYANDTNGNINTSFSFTYDVVEGTVITMTSPDPPGAYYSDKNITISGQTTLPANVTYNLNNGPTNISIVNDSGNFFTWNDSTVEGQNNLTVYAVNSEDPTDSTSKDVSFYVDVTYPNILYNPGTTPSGYHSQDWIFVNVSVNDTNLKTNITLDGISGPDSAWDENDSVNYRKNNTGLLDGTYTINVTVWDKAGNMNVTDSRDITLDNIPPDITLDSPASTVTSDWGTVDLNYTIVEINLNWSAYSLDGAANVTLSGNTTFYNMTNGQHSITIFANDSAGKMNSTTRWFTVNSNITGEYSETLNITADIPYEVNATNTTDAALYITLGSNVNGSINITKMSATPRGTVQTNETNIGKYIQIGVDSSIATNLTLLQIRVHYTDAEVAAAGTSAGSLRLIRWNGTSSTWVNVTADLPWVNRTGVNTAEKYVWANVTQFSIYGVGGDTYVAPPAQRPMGGGMAPEKAILSRAILTTSEDWRYAVIAAGLAGVNNNLLITNPTRSIDLPTRNNIKWFDELLIVGNEFVISQDIEDEFVELRKTIEPGFANLDTSRIGGVNFLDTSAKLARMWKDPEGIIVVRGDVFADALVASQLSASTNSPIIFTMPNEMWPSALETIGELGLPVTIVGGKDAVSKNVEDQISAKGVSVERIAGAERYETAALVADEYISAMKDKGRTIGSITFLSGKKGDWASTLGLMSYVQDSTILYVKETDDKSAMPTATKEYIARHPYISSASIAIKDGSKPRGYDHVSTYLDAMEFDVDPEVHTFIMDRDPSQRSYALDSNSQSLSISTSEKIKKTLRKLGIFSGPSSSGSGGGGSGGGGS